MQTFVPNEENVTIDVLLDDHLLQYLYEMPFFYWLAFNPSLFPHFKKGEVHKWSPQNICEWFFFACLKIALRQNQQALSPFPEYHPIHPYPLWYLSKIDRSTYAGAICTVLLTAAMLLWTNKFLTFFHISRWPTFSSNGTNSKSYEIPCR